MKKKINNKYICSKENKKKVYEDWEKIKEKHRKKKEKQMKNKSWWGSWIEKNKGEGERKQEK